MHPTGFIHGRFQVLHNDHLAYLLAGKERCERLIVGVTNPDAATTRAEAADPKRSSLENNPLSFEERKAMIEAALVEAGVDRHAFSVVPFPINCPELLRERAPRDAVYFLTIYDEWGREKLKRLDSLGLKTEVMWEREQNEKGISGTDVRAAIRDGREWRHLVPPSVAVLVDRWHLAERFRHP